MMDDQLSGFNEDANRKINKKMEALAEDPKFKAIHDHSQLIDEKMKAMVSDPNFKDFNGQMRAVTDEAQLKELEAKPEFKAIQEQAQLIDDEMKAMRAPRWRRSIKCDSPLPVPRRWPTLRVSP